MSLYSQEKMNGYQFVQQVKEYGCVTSILEMQMDGKSSGQCQSWHLGSDSVNLWVRSAVSSNLVLSKTSLGLLPPACQARLQRTRKTVSEKENCNGN